jgi:hypothetical protein
LTIDNCSIEIGGTVFIAFLTFSDPNIGFVSFFNIEFSKKYLLLVEIPAFCSKS